MKVKLLSRVQPSVTLWTAAHQALRPWDSPGKNTGVGRHCLLRLDSPSAHQLSWGEGLEFDQLGTWRTE